MSISKQGIEQTRPELSTHDTDIKADVGDFSGRNYDQTLLDVIGIPDTDGKDLHTLLVTDRLDHATYGLSRLALATVLGAKADAASADDPTSDETAIQYLKQIVNILEGTAGIAGWTAAAAPSNGVSLHEVIRQIYDDVTLALADTGELQTDWVDGGRLDNLLDAIPTTMVGTDSAALASVLGAQNTGVATGVVSDAKAAMAYLKQRVTQGVAMMSFASVADDIIVIPISGADLTFPNVVVAGLPTGANIIRAEVILIIGAILDTSTAENQIATGTTDSLWIKKSTGAWGTDDIECLVFPALGLQVASDAYRGGVVLFGAIDIKSEMDGNATYNIASRETNRTKGVEATGASLELLDVTTIIRVWFS